MAGGLQDKCNQEDNAQSQKERARNRRNQATLTTTFPCIVLVGKFTLKYLLLTEESPWWRSG
jgi:hypothetical protein